MKNTKGPIAETYVDLQGIPNLEKASKLYPTEKYSTWGIVKVLLQATEIGIQNLNDLFSRIIIDLEKNKLGKATTKFSWVKDINYLLIKITNLNNLVCNEILKNASNNSFNSLSQSKFELLYKELDISVKKYLDKKFIILAEILETKTLNNTLYKFLHDYRVVAHELTIWISNLKQYSIPNNTDYNEFIGFNEISIAINNPSLKGDTFFKQFRCLHQIPELLTKELNNQIEFSIIHIRKNKIDDSHKHLRIANELLEITLDCIKPIVNNLSHNDYHQIRENLGLTSGSHSINLHFHLFKDLYMEIASTYVTQYFKNEQDYETILENNSQLKLLEIELLRLRNSINQWREFHLHFPRINLGEKNTKSLIGANEAVESARKMQKVAYERDPLNKIVKLYFPSDTTEKSDFLNYIKSESSFDFIIGVELGKITQKRFVNVQERQGPFARNIPFKPPPKRTI